MLTRKPFELLRFIHERLTEAGVPPSFDEMKDALDLRSKSGIHRLITALEERGFIRRLPNRARAIEVIKLPDSVAHGISGGRSRGFTPSVIEGDLGRVRGSPPIPPTRYASCRPTACVFRASWSGCSGATDLNLRLPYRPRTALRRVTLAARACFVVRGHGATPPTLTQPDTMVSQPSIVT